MPNKPPIINCHAHMFTGDFVPSYLAKTYLPWPIYRFLSLRFIISILRWYHNSIKPFLYTNRYKKWQQFWYRVAMVFKRSYLFAFFKFIIEIYLVVVILYYLGLWLLNINAEYTGIKMLVVSALKLLKASGWIVLINSLFYKLMWLALVLIFFKSIRNLVFALLRQLKVLPGKNFTELFHRYVQIGLFSKYKMQSGIYDKLKKQYPPGTHFVGLPMDMQYMEAGELKKVYKKGNGKIKSKFIKIKKDPKTKKRDKMIAMNYQMEGLLTIKKRPKDQDTFHPFVFAHPERMADPRYFDYKVDEKSGEVTLVEGCRMQVYLEVYKFAGIKIYPALGYYPFDEALLPLWKYCIQHNLPIMTHCIKGTIFYRGKKKTKWDTHEFFKEGKVNKEKQKTLPQEELMDFDINATYIESAEATLHLNEIKNRDFCNNFTHPLNYLCLLEEDQLKKVVAKVKFNALKKANKENQPEDKRIQHLFYHKGKWREGGLKDLKICFAHFGGDDQWKRFLESDRDNYTTQLILQPNKGIEFFKNADGEDSPGKLAYIWKYVDWYTIICSVMLQYKNVYADISYILHDEIILPLLKQTLSNQGLKSKVLYGTDFYVVRNHKTDKAILSDLLAGLTENEFDQIARYNPRVYLNLKTYLPHHSYGIPS